MRHDLKVDSYRQAIAREKTKLIQILTVVGLILTVTDSVLLPVRLILRKAGGFGELLKSMGIFGLLLFLLLQISQTIYPIIPGGLQCHQRRVYSPFGGFLSQPYGHGHRFLYPNF